MNPIELMQISVEDVFWSGLAAVGFAVLFNVPRRLLLGCFFAGATGHFIRTVLAISGSSLEFGTLVGAMAVGFLSVLLANRYDVPASLFAVTGAIPLVPGVFAYQTIVGLLNATAASPDQTVEILAVAAINGVRTGLILSAIAFGIAAPTLLFRRPNRIV
jgi:uncharacterized membrane protein YjjB (DUF3815 family)